LNGSAGDPNGFLPRRFDETQGLGTLADLMSHVTDKAHRLTGEVARVTSDKVVFIKQRPSPKPRVGKHDDLVSVVASKGVVTNGDYVSPHVQFKRDAHGIHERSCVINGAKSDKRVE